MPPGEKLLATLMLEGSGQIGIHTFMPKLKIIEQIRPTEHSSVEEVDTEWAVFEGVNPRDEPVFIQILRSEIRAFVIAPYLMSADLSQPTMGPPHSGSRRIVQ